MADIKKLIVCLFVFGTVHTYNAIAEEVNEEVEDDDLQEIDDDEDKDNKKATKEDDNESQDSTDIETDTEDDSKKQEEKKKGAKGGWYSGLDVKYVPSKLSVSETKSDNKTVEHNIKNNAFNPSLILGYDFLLNKILLGVEASVAYNIGSSTDYKIDNKDIAKIDKGMSYTGAIKLGLNLGSVIVYGKVGGDLSKWKYDWKSENKDNKTETEKKYRNSFVYGCGIEKQLQNSCYIRGEVLYSPNITHENTNKKIDNSNVSNIRTSNYLVSIGGGYRF